VISLRLAGFTVREMAEILDKAEGTIKSLQFAALARLRTDDDLPA
jgi:DNA-directed RNA polymerase specialized sigma24 family protein